MVSKKLWMFVCLVLFLAGCAGCAGSTTGS